MKSFGKSRLFLSSTTQTLISEGSRSGSDVGTTKSFQSPSSNRMRASLWSTPTFASTPILSPGRSSDRGSPCLIELSPRTQSLPTLEDSTPNFPRRSQRIGARPRMNYEEPSYESSTSL